MRETVTQIVYPLRYALWPLEIIMETRNS